MAYEDVPPDLEEWARLNADFDQLALKDPYIEAELDALLPRIIDAWESAPLRVRQSLSATGCYRTWRDRSFSLYA